MTTHPGEVGHENKDPTHNRAQLLEKIISVKLSGTDLKHRIPKPRNADDEPTSLVSKRIPENVSPGAKQETKHDNQDAAQTNF